MAVDTPAETEAESDPVATLSPRPPAGDISSTRVGFERGDPDVAQLILARPLADGSVPERPLRPWC